MLVHGQIADFKVALTSYSNGEPVTIRFAFPAKDTLLSINSITAQILSKRDRIFLLESIITIIRECVFNAVKANAKRVYFEREGRNISDPEEYNRLIALFKEKIMMNFPEMQSSLEMSAYRAEFTITAQDDGITITVTNNVPLLAPERTRIKERIDNANKYHDFTEVYDEMYDDTEGAGLGIILTILILKNSGITNAFSITGDDQSTVATVTIPDTLRPHELSTKVKGQIIEQISVLPTIPHTTVELINMCDNPNTQIAKLSTKIMSDPSLTADILKLANSAGFFTTRKIDNINAALVRIGLKNLKFMLIAASSRTILEKRYKKFESIWNHCLKSAFYARSLAQLLGLRGVDDQAFICGLLHDMGKIVLLSVDLDITNKIAEIVQQHRIRTTTVIEEISIGISHSMIGKLIADKWNFADFLVEGIEFHHSPLQAKEENREIVYVTYLANLLCGVETKKYEYLYADSMVLDFLKIQDESALADLHSKVTALYNEQTNL